MKKSKFTELERRFATSLVRSSKAVQARLSIELVAMALASRNVEYAVKVALSALDSGWLAGTERVVRRAVLDGVADGRKRF